MEFKALETKQHLDHIKEAKGCNLIFKHNTTCHISKRMRSQFEEEAGSIPNITSVYFLDLLAFRNISDAVTEQFGVPHESPQLLVIRDGKCIHNQSLFNISAADTAAVTA